MSDWSDILGKNLDELPNFVELDLTGDGLPPKPEITITTHTPKRNKYNNRRVQADGYTFDSQAEYKRYLELKLLHDAGEIKELHVHPTYTLLPPFTDGQGNHRRGITYEADFSYRDRSGAEIVEDVKGGKATQTPVFRIKQKLLLHKYRDEKDFEFKIVEM